MDLKKGFVLLCSQTSSSLTEHLTNVCVYCCVAVLTVKIGGVYLLMMLSCFLFNLKMFLKYFMSVKFDVYLTN